MLSVKMASAALGRQAGVGGKILHAKIFPCKQCLCRHVRGKILTIVAGKSQNLIEDAIIFEVTGKLAKSSGVLAYLSGMSSTSAKTDVSSRAPTTPMQRQAR